MAISVDATIPNIATDQSALLALKFGISHPDPAYHNILASNWSTNTSVCNWIGVTCGSKHHRVITLNLSYMGLEGTIPPQIGNLSFLVSLRLKNNSFHGSVPNELSRLYRLKNLNFGFNNFNGEIPIFGTIIQTSRIGLAFNEFSGYIPPSLFNISTLQAIDLGDNKLLGPMPSILFNMPSLQSIDLSSNELSGRLPKDTFNHLPNLQWLQLSHNRFYGGLPSTLFSCKHLQYLSVQTNHFTGRVLPAIGNLTMLEKLYLIENDFAGAIPNEIGYLQNLKKLNIGANQFSGPIPFEIFNISTLQIIGMSLNNLFGPLPSNLGHFLPELQMLLLGENELNGTIPSSISNASQLTRLELSKNSFSGFIPNTIGNLALLQYLNLGRNNLTIGSPKMNSLFSSLSNCKYLEVLSFEKNPLNAILPNSIGNLSTSLQKFFLDGSNIKGSIFQDIGNLSSLIILDLSYNELVGLIPTAWEKLSMLQVLYLHKNRLQGPIPSNLCHLKSLFQLSLGGNELVGQIPGCINNLTLLRNLYLGANKLTSTIPLTLWSMKDLLEVDLSSNSLSGPLSLELGNMKVLRELNLSNNRLSGDIPITIGSLKDLYLLSSAQNLFEGSIPESFGDLVSLELLDVSSNNLSGEIPKSLEALIYLKYLNVSFNRLRGEIPTRGPFINFTAASFMSNDALCGALQLQVLPCKKDGSRSKRSKISHILTFSLPTVGLTVILVASLVLISKKCQKKSTGSVDLSPLATWRRVSHHELLRATEGFNPSKLIGEGSFGSVYKATFLDGKDFAIKVLNLQIEGAFHSFDVECDVLSSIRHRNLVKIISACSNMDFKAIVLEYMPNGNLETWLYSGDRFLSMLQRLNIMIDVATALEYLHFGYSKTIVHCDLKPNNILLDEEMVAHVADFGIAKLLGDEDLIKRTMTLATIGYMAPEYGSEGIVSIRGDVYSYGILLMETFTRKKPTDNMFVEEMNLKLWVEESLADLSIIEIIDASLLGDERYKNAATTNSVSSIMGLALDCCIDSPEERINTRSIPIALNKIKSKFLQDFQKT
ncbi:LRR receptor-like serine/threonine-protein kinase EFR [Carya illinoinensis]|uniref:LRR receptor-like serine/threonine-protein kinase EFR n=1 Tax=Carya illinoinensis TaxID=32201 RepID=UPI001C717E58|nr:LRR receptor-like serine/threonine-protein kinase EFR [Carya illinoinensis]